MAADRSAPGGDDGDRASEAGSAGDDEAAAPEPRLWFLRDPPALARRLVLAEILGAPRGRGHTPGHAPPGRASGRRR